MNLTQTATIPKFYKSWRECHQTSFVAVNLDQANAQLVSSNQHQFRLENPEIVSQVFPKALSFLLPLFHFLGVWVERGGGGGGLGWWLVGNVGGGWVGIRDVGKSDCFRDMQSVDLRKNRQFVCST